MGATQKTCFIIMPIKTPSDFIDKYRDGSDHFTHVLDCLFIPALEAAGYSPIPPAAKGSDLIHAEIINNLESTDLVLCDMSCLNPNVFFEFGIRASLNKPVCVVKDEHTLTVPFDTGILNHQEYKSTLEPWELAGEVNKLSEHIKVSYERSKGENTLWRYFGLRTEARTYHGETGIDSNLQLLSLQIDSLREMVSNKFSREVKYDKENDNSNRHRVNGVVTRIHSLLPGDLRVHSIAAKEGGEIVVWYDGEISGNFISRLQNKIVDELGVFVEFKSINSKQKIDKENIRSNKPNFPFP